MCSNRGGLGGEIAYQSSGQTITSHEDSAIPEQQFEQQNQTCNYEPSQYSTKLETDYSIKLDSECTQIFPSNYDTKCDENYETSKSGSTYIRKFDSDLDPRRDSEYNSKCDTMSRSAKKSEEGFFKIHPPNTPQRHLQAMRGYKSPGNVDCEKGDFSFHDLTFFFKI